MLNCMQYIDCPNLFSKFHTKCTQNMGNSLICYFLCARAHCTSRILMPIHFFVVHFMLSYLYKFLYADLTTAIIIINHTYVVLSWNRFTSLLSITILLSKLLNSRFSHSKHKFLDVYYSSNAFLLHIQYDIEK